MNGPLGERYLPITPPDFDRIARPYRWLEYLTMGRVLERCRLHFLGCVADRRRAVVLGDGDGRFIAALMAQNPTLIADAVDTSGVMLRLLRERCQGAALNSGSRVRTHKEDALRYLGGSVVCDYDLVVTHFFLDCLTQLEVDALAEAVVEKIAPDAVWLVSDFRIPKGPMRLPARAIVKLLYLAFSVLTGLRTKRLPSHEAALTRTGFTRIDCHYSLSGILTTEVWARGAKVTRP